MCRSNVAPPAWSSGGAPPVTDFISRWAKCMDGPAAPLRLTRCLYVRWIMPSPNAAGKCVAIDSRPFCLLVNGTMAVCCVKIAGRQQCAFPPLVIRRSRVHRWAQAHKVGEKMTTVMQSSWAVHYFAPGVIMGPKAQFHQAFGDSSTTSLLCFVRFLWYTRSCSLSCLLSIIKRFIFISNQIT